MNKLVKSLAGLVVAGLAIATLVYAYTCPCAVLPGLWLQGEEITTKVDDWTFANDVKYCEVEVSSWKPHSVTVNCMATPQGDLFISCSQCEGKTWSSIAVSNPSANIRILESVYPVQLVRVTAKKEREDAWQARHLKTQSFREPAEQSDKIPEIPEHWWTFQVKSANQPT